MKQQALAVYENQEYPFEALVAKLELSRDLSRNPLFDTMFVLQNLEIQRLELPGLRLTPHAFDHKIAKFDLTMEALEEEAEIHFSLAYSTVLFKKDTMLRMTGHFEQLLQAAICNPNAAIADMNMLTSKEKTQIVDEFNATKAVYTDHNTIYQLFEEQVEKTPENIAIVFRRTPCHVSRTERSIESIGAGVEGKGVQADSLVGLLVERSVELAIGMMAILKAGGAYVPIDPSYPKERIQYMLEDSTIKILLTQQRMTELVHFEGEMLCMDEEHWYSGAHNNLEPISGPENLAYIIYTSGTTGKPKGYVLNTKELLIPYCGEKANTLW